MKGCPQAEITQDVWDAMSAARYARNGTWPEAGGTNDQTAVFLAACEICWSEEDAVRAELKLTPQD